MNMTKILCLASKCVHRSGEGYYGICEHPASKQIVPYGGITRFYTERCDLYERANRTKGDKI